MLGSASSLQATRADLEIKIIENTAFPCPKARKSKLWLFSTATLLDVIGNRQHRSETLHGAGPVMARARRSPGLPLPITQLAALRHVAFVRPRQVRGTGQENRAWPCPPEGEWGVHGFSHGCGRARVTRGLTKRLGVGVFMSHLAAPELKPCSTQAGGGLRGEAEEGRGAPEPPPHRFVLLDKESVTGFLHSG